MREVQRFSVHTAIVNKDNYTSWRTTPVWFSYSHYRAIVCPIGERIHVYYQCLP
jgi:hypothetical protein